MIKFYRERGPPGAINSKKKNGSMPKRTWTRVSRIIGVMRSQHHPSYFGELMMTLSIKSFRLFFLTIVVFIGTCLNSVSVQAQFDDSFIRAVDATSGSCGDGTTWGSAYKYLQDALDEAAIDEDITQIWVADGTYFPDQDCANPDGTGLRTATFNLLSNVEIYGGFLGAEANLILRNPALNTTVLSGAITIPDTEGCDGAIGRCCEAHPTPGCDNALCCFLVCEVDSFCCDIEWDALCAVQAVDLCNGCDYESLIYGAYHVVRAILVDETALLDGFTITKGFASSQYQYNGFGAGIYIDNSSPTIVRCTITDNSVTVHGGGAINITGNSNPLLVNCSLTNNDAIQGGAIHTEVGAARAILINCLLADNSTTPQQGVSNHGGAIDHGGGSPATPLILINCTIANNTATFGGAIYVHLGAHVIVVNSVLWNNADDEIVIGVGGGTVNATYSDIQGAPVWPGIGNINLDPLFLDPDNGDYRLMFGSPCIEKGNNSAVPCDEFDVDQDGFNCTNSTQPTPDLDLLDRIVNGLVDMGVYEYPDLPCPWDLDGNGVVGTSDLLELFAQWGTAGPADFDGSGAVGTNDLLILFANWGPCPGSGLQDPLTVEEELIDACLTMDNWNEYVGVMMGSANQATKDRYKCWMEHYINDCNRCTCLGPVPCPAPDPFDD